MYGIIVSLSDLNAYRIDIKEKRKMDYQKNELVVAKMIETYHCRGCVKEKYNEQYENRKRAIGFDVNAIRQEGVDATPFNINEVCLIHGMEGMRELKPLLPQYVLFHPDYLIHRLTFHRYEGDVVIQPDDLRELMFTDDAQIPMHSMDAHWLIGDLEEPLCNNQKLGKALENSQKGYHPYPVSLHIRPSNSLYPPTERWGGSKVTIIQSKCKLCASEPADTAR